MSHTHPTPQLPPATRYRITLRHLAMDDLVPLMELLEKYEAGTGTSLHIEDPEVEAAS